MAFQYDFSGYATKNDLLCSDGRTIRSGAFADQDGETVPLVWNHDHKGMENVIGHALLENRADGVYAYGVFNETPNGKNAKTLVKHGDITALSIYANKLKQRGGDVLHGKIRELSLVFAGANPGAYIDSVLAHGEEDEEAVIYTGEEISLQHGAVADRSSGTPANMINEKEDSLSMDKDMTVQDFIESLPEKKQLVITYLIDAAIKNATKTGSDSFKVQHADVADAHALPDEETVADVWDTFSDNEKKIAYALIGAAVQKALGASATTNENQNEEDSSMKHNAFDYSTFEDPTEGILTHSDQEAIIRLAKSNSCGSLQEAIEMYSEDCDHLQHGIDEIETLFPDYKDVKPGAPELLTDELAWVGTVMNGVHKSPVSRIRTRQMDARGRKLRGLGYKKGNQKKEVGNVKLLSRTTDPCTVFVKDSMHRDDIIDITDFDVVSYMYGMLRTALNEEIATAIMVGDGREDTDEDKIAEDKIRPIWTDDELFTLHKNVDVAAMKTTLQGTETGAHFGDEYITTEAIIQANLNARIDYKGSGSPTMFCTPQLVNTMLMARDLNGRRIYNGINELKSILNVKDIVTVEQFNGLVRTDSEGAKKELLAIIVNLNDYYVGATKGGEISQFNQFDIDFNKEKYLIETRCSGALTKVQSAIVLETVQA